MICAYPVNVMQLSEIHCITLFILQGENCGLHKFFVSFNLILSVAVSVIAILPKIQDGKILLPCECFLWCGVNYILAQLIFVIFVRQGILLSC